MPLQSREIERLGHFHGRRMLFAQAFATLRVSLRTACCLIVGSVFAPRAPGRGGGACSLNR